MTEITSSSLQIIIITGASSGIGMATAKKLAEQGKNLILIARRKAPLDAVAASLRQQHPEGVFLVIAGDLAHHQEREAVINSLQHTLRNQPCRLAGLIHCAGMGTPTNDLCHWNPDDLNAALALNVIAPLTLIQTLLPYLDEDTPPCRVILVGAGIDRRAQPGTGTYGISKMALRRLFEQLILDLAPYSASVALFQPGMVDTPGLRQHIRAAHSLALPHADYLQQRLVQGDYLTAESAGGALAILLDQVSMEKFSGQEWHARQLLDY